MALFENKKEDDKKSYIALLDEAGEDLIAFIHPTKTVGQELLVEALKAKGLNVEIRKSADAMTELKL